MPRLHTSKIQTAPGYEWSVWDCMKEEQNRAQRILLCGADKEKPKSDSRQIKN